MRKKEAYLVLDTETVEINPRTHEQAIWNVGYLVARKRDNRIEYMENCVISNVYNKFKGNKFLEQPKQLRAEAENSTKYRNFEAWLNHLRYLIAEYNITEIWAYNSSFDKSQIEHQIAKWGLEPLNIRWFDIWKYAECITTTKKYLRWCLKNQLLSPKGNPLTSAEAVGNYITGETNKEEHLALGDVRDFEFPILLACKARNHKKPIKNGGWQEPAKVFKQYIKDNNINIESIVINING